MRLSCPPLGSPKPPSPHRALRAIASPLEPHAAGRPVPVTRRHLLTAGTRMEGRPNATAGALLKRPVWPTVSLACVLGALFVLTVCGNVLVCLVVCHNRKLRNLTNCFIVSLAVTDLLLGLLVLPFSAVNELFLSWPFGATFCNVYTSLDVMLCTASILNLFMISLDRYYAVTAPLRYAMLVTPSRVAVALGVIWVVSFMVSFPPIHLGWNTVNFTVQNKGAGDRDTTCMLELNKGYALLDAFGTFYLPLLVMCVTYYRIFKIAREQAKRINTATCSGTAGAHLHSHLALPSVREHKATVTLAAVMGAFIVCWFPYFTVFTYLGLQGHVDQTVYGIVLWLGYANSALNPILYAALNRDFRTAYSQLLHCRQVGPAAVPALHLGRQHTHGATCEECPLEEHVLTMQDRNGEYRLFLSDNTQRSTLTQRLSDS
ncbi:histamine H2 receptor-like [Polypterus senegalus]